jgi:DNA-binding winged helix-turn-helix (wHTH) protein/TolB-like protein
MSDVVRFGSFDANLKSGELRREGRPVVVQDLPFRLLAALLERPGEVVTRAELTARLWGTETFVDATAGLNTAIAKLREALGDDAERPVWIETVPKRGYRFVGTIEAITNPAKENPAEENPAKAGSPVPTGGAHVLDRPTTRAWDPALAGPTNRAWDPALAGLIVSSRKVWVIAAITIVLLAIVAYTVRIGRTETRVAVVLFDNETGNSDLGRLAQALTDATVFELTRSPSLAVIGNAALLRTARPFRDIEVIRDALSADLIVIGQVQLVDGQVLVRSHLIRARDQVHVWVSVARLTSTEAALQSEVAQRIATAVSAHYVGFRAVTTTSGS